MVRFDATINFEENCNYNSSIKQDIIEVPLIKTFATLHIDNANDPQIQLYYNDPIKCTITVVDNNEHPIGNGKAIFFYKYEHDYLNEWHQINDKPIKIDRNGNASVTFIPHDDVKIKAEYYGEPYYQDCKTSEEIAILKEIPTSVVFDLPDKNYPTHFVDPEATIKMTVNVFNLINGEPINYGVVTFLHYFTHDIDNLEDGVERVIGNPVFVKDGKATITYSPMQLRTIKEYSQDEKYKTWDIFKNIELISAVYNYDNEAYGEKWHYYRMHQDYTTISVLQPNIINIDIEKEENGNRVHLNTERADIINIDKTEELYRIADNESFILSAKIVWQDEDSDIIEEIGSEGNKIIFTIVDNDTIINEIEAMYNSDKEQFETIVESLPAGHYHIYAKLPEHEKYNADDITLVKKETEITKDNNENRLQNVRYLQSNKSEDIYLEVEPAEIECKLNLLAEEIVYDVNNSQGYDKNKIILSIDIEDPFLLDGAICYFLVNNQIKTGKIEYKNNKLIGHPNDNILMPEVNNYTIRAYILNGTYSYEDGNMTISKTLPTIYSQPIIIKARNNINIEISNFTVQDKYPGSVKFNLKGNNLYTDILNVNIKMNNDFIMQGDERLLYQLINNNIVRATINNIDVGNHYQITAIVSNEDISVPAITSPIFNIEKNILQSNLYNTEIIAAKQQTIPIGIHTQNNTNLNEINLNNLSITITDPNQEKFNNIIDVTIDDNISNDQLLYLLIILKDLKYIEGDWSLFIEYQEDEHYIMTADNLFNFRVYNNVPTFMLSFDKENNLIGQVTYDGSYNNDGQILNIQLTFTDINEQIVQTLNKETDEHGFFVITNNDFNSMAEWNNWTDITVRYNEEDNPEVIGYQTYEEDFNRKTIKIEQEIQVEEDVVTGDNELQP